MCSIDGCNGPVVARGWCEKHYRKWRKYGDPLKGQYRRGQAEKHPLYHAWGWAKRKSPGVCNHWLSFWNFIDDVGDRPSVDHKLHRIDEAKKIGPDNYEWRKIKHYAGGDRSLYARKMRAHDPIAEKRRNLKSQYGIELDQYNAMLSDQGGVCAICGLPETALFRGVPRELAVDHCHETGRVRGLLCTSCNVGIGHLKDSTELLKRAIEYLS